MNDKFDYGFCHLIVGKDSSSSICQLRMEFKEIGKYVTFLWLFWHSLHELIVVRVRSSTQIMRRKT